MTNIQNTIVLITGASSGIGEACANLLAKHGARLILTARRVDLLTTLAKTLKENFGTDTLTCSLDVRNAKKVQDTLATLPQGWQDITVLINNAGLALSMDPLQSGNPENWDTVIDTNIKGLLYVSRAILPGMLQRKRGHVINIGSIAGQECYPGGNVYCATKHAVRALSKSMRLDLSGSPIRVTEISPGAVDTEFSTVRFADAEKAHAFYQDFTPLMATDIADAIYYCLTRPAHVDIAEMTIMPTDQAGSMHIHRKRKNNGP